MKKKLNIGCGYNLLSEYHNVDIDPLTGCDEVVDLETFPLPWLDNSFEEILACHSLEHMGESPRVFMRLLQELYRISAPGCRWHLIVPHWRDDDFFHDPTHVRVITPNMITLFDQRKNMEDIALKRANTKHGLAYGVDLELLEASFDLREPWATESALGRIRSDEMKKIYESQANVCHQVRILAGVHKPARFDATPSGVPS